MKYLTFKDKQGKQQCIVMAHVTQFEEWENKIDNASGTLVVLDRHESDACYVISRPFGAVMRLISEHQGDGAILDLDAK